MILLLELWQGYLNNILKHVMDKATIINTRYIFCIFIAHLYMIIAHNFISKTKNNIYCMADEFKRFNRM